MAVAVAVSVAVGAAGWPLGPACAICQHEFVDVVNAGFAAHALELGGQVGREQIAQALADGACRAGCR